MTGVFALLENDNRLELKFDVMAIATKEQIEQYRREKVTLLCALLNEVKTAVQEPVTANIPAYPEKYGKKDWESANYSIETIVSTTVLPELKHFLDKYPDNHLLIVSVIRIIELTDWEEV